MFADRREAGRLLGERLAARTLDPPVVLALPRGGVPVAAEIAKALDAPLDVLVVRKLGFPLQRELGMGAIAEGGIRVLNTHLLAQLGVTPAEVEAVTAAERQELDRRLAAYRDGRPPVEVRGRTVVLVDDGIATGYTARTAITVLRHRGAGRIVLAVPVAAPETLADFDALADEVECLEAPRHLMSIGSHYRDFGQTTDEEVRTLLAAAASEERALGDPADPMSREVQVEADGARLPGMLDVPPDALGVVVFAHGSGSGRMSPRNQAVARYLRDAGLGTLLVDLLTPEEADDRDNVFDIDLLAARLEAAVAWLRARPGVPEGVGFFGASTGAGAALQAAAAMPDEVEAVVSRGGRPDLARGLQLVRAPTLLIVGGADQPVLALNEKALGRLQCEKRLDVVPGATHLFEEPGALEVVGDLAAAWFVDHLGTTSL